MTRTRGARLLPVARGQIDFESREFALGRADEVAHGQVARTHLLERCLSRDAAVHNPDAFRFAVLLFDLGQEVLERGLVGGVARQHFVGEGKTLGRNNEGDDDLHAVAALIAAVAKAAQIGGIGGRIAFKICAGQIVEEHF